MSEGYLTPRPLVIRKRREPDTITPTHRFNHENLAVKLPTLAGRKDDGRRAITANDAVWRLASTAKSEFPPSLQRQPSFKYRLLNRMMSGLTTRTQIDGINEGDEKMGYSQFKPKERRDASRDSTESSRSNNDGTKNLERTLAAFPTPPTSNGTFSSTDGLSESAGVPKQAYRDLRVPRHNITLSAELRILPYHSLQGSDRSTLVAINICTVADDASFDPELDSKRNSVDVAVVIDNSLYNSPASLMASCEITGLVASLLDPTTDRFAVLCSMPSNTNQSSGNGSILWSLSPINVRRLRATLDTITNSTAKPDSAALAVAIKHARRILTKSSHLPSLCDSAPDTFGHVIILTADISGLDEEDLGHETIQTHIIFPGVPQQRKWDEIDCNGWKMFASNPFGTESQPCYSRIKNDTDPYSLNNKLAALIRHARRGRLADFLTDIRLEVQPRLGFRVEKTMGLKNYSKLRIGEVKTVLVRFANERSCSGLDYFDASRLCSSAGSAHGDDLIAELDRVLGLPKDGMMTVKLRYKHSSLPANTTCTTIAKCLLPLQSPTTESQNVDHKPVSSKSTSLIHQRLAEYYIASSEPRDALSAFRLEFGENSCRSACPIYTNALADELRYQARISERIAIEHSTKKSKAGFDEPHPGTRVELFGPPSSHYENCKPQDWAGIPQKTENLTPGGSHVEVAEQLGFDDARKIWNDLRNRSRGDKNESSRRKESTSMTHRERAKKMRETALKDKRSIGESATRSFSTPLKSSSRNGLVAPWL